MLVGLARHKAQQRPELPGIGPQLDGDRRRQATLAQPSGIATDGRYLYWVDPESSAARRVSLTGDGEVETIVGTGLFDYGNEEGRGKKAKLQHP